MNSPLFIPILIMIIVLILNAGAAFIFISGMFKRRSAALISRKIKTIIMTVLFGQYNETDIFNKKNTGLLKKYKWIFLENCAKIIDTVILNTDQKSAIIKLIVSTRLNVTLVRELNSNKIHKRLRSSAYLVFLESRPIKEILVKALEREKVQSVQLAIIGTLVDLNVINAIPTIIDTLKNTPLRYQQIVWGLLMEFGDDLMGFTDILIGRPDKEIKLLLIHIAQHYYKPELRDQLETFTRDKDLDIVHGSFRILSSVYGSLLDHRKYIIHDDFLIRNLTAESLGNIPNTKSLSILFDSMDDPVIKKSIVLALTSIGHTQPAFLRIMMHRCLNEQREIARRTLAETLSHFVGYLMSKLLSQDAEIAEKVIFELIKNSQTNKIINFINKNSNKDIEEKVLALIRRVLNRDSSLANEFLMYLNKRIKHELGMPNEDTQSIPLPKYSYAKKPVFYIILFISIFFLPLVCAGFSILSMYRLNQSGLVLFLKNWTNSFNFSFVIYSVMIYTINFILLFFSLKEVQTQAQSETLLRTSRLFTEYQLPSVSIISPAYNEEATIIENVNSLFNLEYPDYEIIVVNDGSRDATLQRLVDYFELERTERFVHSYLDTREIKAIYANKRYPELVVIDKENGGKADSLNAGINIAGKEYFSGIDADSLLERKALIRLTSRFVFSDQQVVAAGGNIFPVNGCSVRKGDITAIRIPRKKAAVFQTIEYIRAFMASRIGWSRLKLLLIISGAFGVFHRRSVINAHGYLTQSEHYHKDTVGEDMELVVRMCREMREIGKPFSILYRYDANCWTEVPEHLPSLANQRDRWQRGLVDIITFHSRMIANPKYGRIGLFGFPYFLVFEVFGPWFEFQGFLVFITSIILGWITLPYFFIIFTATSGLGFFVSLVSLFIAEYKADFFRMRDKLRLLFYTLAENLGFRHFFNFLRIRGHFRMLFKSGGWGKIKRSGWSPGKKKKGVNTCNFQNTA